MPKNNSYYIKTEINKKPVEIVHELKGDEYKVPSFEEFMKDYQADEKVENSYRDEINSYDDLGVQRSHGPCSYSGCPYSTPFEVEIYIEGNSRK